MPTPIISIRNASVVYGEHSGTPQRALDDISLDIYEHEYVIFFGPSGCGKSTILYAIAGLEQLSSGSIASNGYALDSLSVTDAIRYHRSSIGMVFQAYYLISTLTNMQNVTLPQVFTSKSKREREAEAMQYLSRFGIDEQAHKFPNQLSGGQQQRVSIARALINKAPILLADEPVGNLDSKAAESVLEVFTQLNKKDGKTIIMVTHNPNHLKYADRVFYMKDGKIVREVRNVEAEIQEKKEQEVQPFINHGLQEFAKIYPHLEEDELKAKMVTWYLLNELDIQAEQRLEQIVGEYIKKKISLEEFQNIATAPIRKSGIGLYHPFAERMSKRLDHIARMSEYMIEKFRSYPSSYEEYQIILDTVTAYLLEITEHKSTPELLTRLQSIIKSRLEGSLGHDGFMALLDKPFAQGGAGLNVRTARNIARQLELILMNFDEMKRGIGDKKLRPHLFGIKNKGEIRKDATDIPTKPISKEVIVPKVTEPVKTIADVPIKAMRATPIVQKPVAASTPSAAPTKKEEVPISQTSPVVHTPRIDEAKRAVQESEKKMSPAIEFPRDPVEVDTSVDTPSAVLPTKRVHTAVRKSEVVVPATSHAKSKSDLGSLERMTVEQLERLTENALKLTNGSFVLPEVATPQSEIARDTNDFDASSAATAKSVASVVPTVPARTPTSSLLIPKPHVPHVIMPKPSSSGDIRSYTKPIQHPAHAQSVLPPKPPPRMYVPIEGLVDTQARSESKEKPTAHIVSAEHTSLDTPHVVFADKIDDVRGERPRRIITIQ
ncbi:MAG: ATP-binding cassette domain-containing protein [Patescibacteria group bacterium]